MYTYMMKDVIKRLRLKKGLTQDDMAKALGLTTPSYSRMELGITKISEAKLDVIARALRMTTEELIYENDQQENTKVSRSQTGAYSPEHIELLQKHTELQAQLIQALKKIDELKDKIK